jgi:pimeloyl-ACP methyl ester carboxylesterase
MKQRIRLANTDIAYTRQGNGEPLVALHGFPTSGYLFHAMTPFLTERFTIYSLDLMGYGDSLTGPEQPLHLEAQAEMVAEFADTLRLPEFTLVGHDLGGGIGQVMGLRYPERLRRMVWINTVMDDNFPIGRIRGLNLALRASFARGLLKHSPLLRWWAGSPWGLRHGVAQKGAMNETARQEFVLKPFLATPEGRERFFRVVAAQRENGQITRRIAVELRKITTPTLLLWGAEDAFFSLRWPEKLRGMTNCVREFHAIPNAGHFCPLEQPALIAGHIREFGQKSKVEG